jgi:hypothetical protein
MTTDPSSGAHPGTRSAHTDTLVSVSVVGYIAQNSRVTAPMVAKPNESGWDEERPTQPSQVRLRTQRCAGLLLSLKR